MSGVLGRGAMAQLAAGTRTVRVALNAAGRRALRKPPPGTYALAVTVKDSAGNSRRLSRTLRFR